MSALDTLVANLKHAVRSGESVSIGGGIFTPRELEEALAEVEALKAKEPK